MSATKVKVWPHDKPLPSFGSHAEEEAFWATYRVAASPPEAWGTIEGPSTPRFGDLARPTRERRPTRPVARRATG